MYFKRFFFIFYSESEKLVYILNSSFVFIMYTTGFVMNNIFLNISGDLVNINITFKWHVYIAENNQRNNQNIPILHWNIITNITCKRKLFFYSNLFFIRNWILRILVHVCYKISYYFITLFGIYILHNSFILTHMYARNVNTVHI